MPRREPLNYGLILLLFALIAYAAIGLTIGAEPASGDELRGPNQGASEAGTASWGSTPGDGAAAASGYGAGAVP
jgi:hypothetical protein